MADKVIVAVFDDDLRIRTYKRVEVTRDGGKLKVKSGGKGHFYPELSPNGFLEFPYRSILSPWKLSFRRVYIVKNHATECVNFNTGKVPLPDPEQVASSANATLIKNFGKDEEKTPWWVYISLFMLFIILLIVSGVAR